MGHRGSSIPGQVISHEFFMGNRIKYDVPRGPFCSSFEWLRPELFLIIYEQREALEKAEDEDDREDAEDILEATRKLLSVLANVFSDEQLEGGDEIETALYHDDLNLHNILFNKEGEITAIVDWECVSAMPM
jgi:Ser/Thr protein kinase RdoA (MazF antagonist)